MIQSKPIPTRRHNPCVVCGDIRGRCREFSAHPDMILCMEVLDAPSTPPGFKFQGLSKDGTWGIIIRDTGEVDEAARKEWLQRWRQLRVERLRQERASRAQLLDEPTRDTHIRKILTQLGLSSLHRENLKKRGLSDELIAKGMFRSVERWQRLDIEVSWNLAGVALGGRSLMTPHTGYLCPVWNPQGQIIAWQLRVDDPGDDNPKYLWASSRTKKRPNGPTAHLQNGELPLTFCSPVEEIDSTRILAQYIGLAEGILKPWIIAQQRNQITIGAAGGNFAGSPETLKTYLTAASIRLGGTQDLILWADAGAIANKNVMRQYRRTYELVTRWGYTLKVAWWGQLDKSCADPDEYAGEFEILTWAQFESLSRNPLRLWDDVIRSLDKIKRLLRPGRGFARRVRHSSSYNSGNQSNGLPRFIQHSTPEPISVYTPDDLPTLEEYKKLGCPKINYLGDERVSIWQEAVKKGWQHILDKSARFLRT